MVIIYIYMEIEGEGNRSEKITAAINYLKEDRGWKEGGRRKKGENPHGSRRPKLGFGRWESEPDRQHRSDSSPGRVGGASGGTRMSPLPLLVASMCASCHLDTESSAPPLVRRAHGTLAAAAGNRETANGEQHKSESFRVPFDVFFFFSST